jgi:hypothetical protein
MRYYDIERSEKRHNELNSPEKTLRLNAIAICYFIETIASGILWRVTQNTTKFQTIYYYWWEKHISKITCMKKICFMISSNKWCRHKMKRHKKLKKDSVIWFESI